MRRSSLVGHVIEVVDIILAGRRPADVVVRDFFRARHYLGSSDRRFIAARTFDILRHYMLVAQYCSEAMAALHRVPPAPPWPAVALVAAHELRCTGLPDVSPEPLGNLGDAWQASFPDIECTAFQAAVKGAEIPAAIRSNEENFLSVRHSIPVFIVHDWIRRFGGAETGELCATMNAPAPISIRVNTLKCNVETCREALQREGLEVRPGAISPTGLALAKRVNVQGLLSFRQGWFEMQDEGSQLVSLLLGAREGMTILDACAGGGGKGLHLSALMKNCGRLIAADVDERKLMNFLDRGRRAGVTIAETVVATDGGEPAELKGLSADAVLVDAPCSGTGTFRRNPWMKMNLTGDDADACASAQRALLDRYARYVRPGGRLVYSTCTLLQKENQDVAQSFLQDHREFHELPVPEILMEQGVHAGGAPPYLELLPHRTTTDGFFGAVMERRLLT